MSALRALLFDVDGTLAETERDGHRVAFNRAFADHGLPWHWSEPLYGELLQVAGGKERIEHFARGQHPQWLARPAAAAAVAAIHRRKNRIYEELLRGGRIALRKGLRQLLAQAHEAGIELGLVTTTSRGNVEALLQATLDGGTRAALRLCIAGEDVQRKKPDPQCYRLALSALGLPPHEVLAVEDSRNGLRAAKAAGLQTLIVRSFYFAGEDFGGALAVVDGFEQMDLAWLRRRFGQRGAASLPGHGAAAVGGGLDSEAARA